MSDYLPLAIARIEGNTFIHQLHPLTKLIWAIGILIVAAATRNPGVLGAIFVLSLGMIAWAHVWVGYRPLMLTLLPIMCSVVVFQSLAPAAYPPPWTAVVNWGPFTIYREGVYSGLSLLTRILAATNFAALLVLTTHPTDLFSALHGLGFPHELNFMATASLQMIPIVQREFSLVLEAQRSRGMKVRGFAAVLPSFVPVFAGTIERVQQLAMSLEARAFGSSGKKTSLRHVQASASDYAVAGLGVIVSALLVVFLRMYDAQLDWSHQLFIPAWAAVLWVGGSALAFLVFAFEMFRRTSNA